MPRIPRPPEANIDIRLYDYLRQLDSSLTEIPVIVADEIARQIDALPDAEASPPASAYGVVIPPFRACFVEAATMAPSVGLVQRGMYVQDLTPDWRAGELAPAIHAGAPAGTAWIVSAMGYLRMRGQLQGYGGALLLHLDSAGRLLDDTEAIPIVSHPAGLGQRHQLPAAGLANHAPYLLKAISAMHQRAEADKVTPQRQQRRAAERQGVRQLHDYYVLRVKPSAGARDMADVGQAQRAAGRQREHIVRGHFRYYGEDRPMFGRPGAVGMVWIPAHERGDSAIGRIQKDYEVEE